MAIAGCTIIDPIMLSISIFPPNGIIAHQLDRISIFISENMSFLLRIIFLPACVGFFYADFIFEVFDLDLLVTIGIYPYSIQVILGMIPAGTPLVFIMMAIPILFLFVHSSITIPVVDF